MTQSLGTQGQRVALLVTFMFVFSALGLGIVATTDDSEAADTSYTISMFTGDSFSYTPAVNLSGSTISASGNGLTSGGGFLTWASGKLSGSATAKGTFSVVLTASWSSGSLSQTSKQTITFKVYDHTKITSTNYNSGAVVGKAYDYQLTYTGNGEETVSVTGLPTWLTYNTTTKKISGTPAAADANKTSNVVVKVNNATTGDSDTLNMAITVYNDLAFLSTATAAVVNKTLYSYTVQISDVPDAVVSKITGPAWLTYNTTTKILSGTPTLAEGNQYTDVTVKLRATSAILSKSIDQDFTIRVWDTLEYITTPTASMVVTGEGMSVQVTDTSTGAEYIRLSMGDGTIYDMTPGETVSYTYQSAGMRTIALTAGNGAGENTAYTMFEATSEGDDNPPIGPGDDEGGSGGGSLADDILNVLWNPLAIVLLIAAAICYIASRKLEYGALTWIAVILALLSVAAFASGFTFSDLKDAFNNLIGER